MRCCWHVKRAGVSPSLDINKSFIYVLERTIGQVYASSRYGLGYWLCLHQQEKNTPVSSLVEVLMRISSWREVVLADTW